MVSNYIIQFNSVGRSYWLNDVITAAAVWNPHIELDQEDALNLIISQILLPFGNVGSQLSSIIMDTISLQRNYLINGLVNGKVRL